MNTDHGTRFCCKNIRGLAAGASLTLALFSIFLINIFSTSKLLPCRFGINYQINALSIYCIPGLFPSYFHYKFGSKKKCFQISTLVYFSVFLLASLSLWVMIIIASSQDSSWMSCMPALITFINMLVVSFLLFLFVLVLMVLLCKLKNIRLVFKSKNQTEGDEQEIMELRRDVQRLNMEVQSAQNERNMFQAIIPVLNSMMEVQR